ncbi:MAG: Re/Si-specific NAD(P)(+) transhydrogenase subunit alpha [candidate division Zixibacteria bacterium]|nr:Re/Si-specific NAD(P)(+) transhydrogenase subunit alpha [candidate division Zixibacteria bacterium]MBU1469520.1 Re/Si-specific NAD(P)(+) transhydrogenase subunit alpha [candidate division Zixibacteria bacterium]MBU2624756.1 Re/Si-specific NAD(P)(+) transhydrogenase subunit alpha [candidate division Zixibacteria bacterium]
MTNDAKPLSVGVPKETFPDERRVAVVPDIVPQFVKSGMKVILESGAGIESGITDAAFRDRGAVIESDRSEVFEHSDIILQVRGYGANPDRGRSDLEFMRKGQSIIGLFEPLTSIHQIKDIADLGVNLFAVEMMPRITRAQSMDTLSSMATIAGYKAVLMAANALPKMFPMLMTAAGTIAPARVFIVGAGVAGLMAIASAKRLGAVVSAYDVRPAVKEQVQSLGAEFLEIELAAADSEDKGGYAKEMDEEFYRKQREMMTKVVAASDVVITTAAVPGKKAPVLITSDMVKGMSPGSVIVDLAAERGGNCELTKQGEQVVVDGVLILGPANVPSTVPFHASQMYSKNLLTFLKHLVKDGQLQFDMEDEITRGTLMTRGGDVVHPGIREMLGLEPITQGREG